MLSLRYAYLRCYLETDVGALQGANVIQNDVPCSYHMVDLSAAFGKQCNCLAEIVGVAVLKHQLLLVVAADLVAAWRPSLHPPL